MLELTTELFRIRDNGAALEAAPAIIDENNMRIENPSIKVYNRFGFFPKEVTEPEKPIEEEGYVVYDDGYKLSATEEGATYIKRCYRKLKIVDEGEPELGENQELVGDEWIESDTERTHVYHIVDIVDEPPALEEGQQIVGERWEVDLAAGVKRKIYEVRFIVDNPPELPEGQSWVDDYWEDDGITKTHVYVGSMFVVDDPPKLEEGQEIVDKWYEDDPNTNTRTWHYEVRTIVDPGMPELKENEFLGNEYWDDDGVTRTHVYEVWTKVDQVPEYNEETQRLITTDEWVENWEEKKLVRKYIVKDIIDERPADDPDGNFKYVEDGEEETETQIIKKYKKIDRVWRIFSKLDLELALHGIGKLEAFDAFIDSLEIPNELGGVAKVRRFYDTANELKENHALFKPFYMQALEAMGMTEEEGEAILSKCAVSAV